MKSIIQDEKVCFFCGNPECFDHHVFFGSNRKVSEKYGLKVWLCLEHHTAGSFSPHRNRDVDVNLKQILQREFEKKHSRELFMVIIGKNYLEE